MSRSPAASPEHRDNPLRKIAGLSGDDSDLVLIHERMRLSIVSVLAVNDTLTFSELKELLDITDGNLSVHARKLEDGGLIACTKSFVDRVPRSEYRITAKGKRALQRYLDHMESLIKTVRRSS